MADILCGSCGEPAVLTLMMFGPDGGSMDLCNTHAAEWAYGVVKGAYPELGEMLERLEQDAAQAAETAQEPPKRRGRGKARGEEAEAPPEPPEPQEGATSLQGAEHGGGDTVLELGS